MGEVRKRGKEGMEGTERGANKMEGRGGRYGKGKGGGGGKGRNGEKEGSEKQNFPGKF